MAHHHHHHHPHTLPENMGKAFGWGIGLNMLFVVVEVAAGLYTSSLALLTDAGHNLSDVASLVLSWIALQLSGITATGRLSYGYRKGTIWVSLINGLALLVAVCFIVYEAFQRLDDPPPIPGLMVSGVAVMGIAVNAFSAWLFYSESKHDLNIKGAYLHLMADAAVSAGVVLAGLLMYATGWQWIDPAISFVIAGIILWGTLGLLHESIRLALDGVPQTVDLKAVEAAALETPGVLSVHHVHVWALSTSENALTAHLVLDKYHTLETAHAAKQHFRHALEHMDIRHATIETEAIGTPCGCVAC